jgi:hypothetical protein
MQLLLIKMNRFLLTLIALFTPVWLLQAERILIETESFSDHGGWKLDTQFIREMGSPYLLAHGQGTPVQDASTKFEVKEAGSYQIFARTLVIVLAFDLGQQVGYPRTLRSLCLGSGRGCNHNPCTD